MKTLTDHLTMYAEYHRDKRNIATHFVGIPLIVLSITTLLSVPALSFNAGGLPLNAAIVLALFSCLFYLRLDLAFGLTMTALMIGMVLGGEAIVQAMPEQAVTVGIALFVVGWIFQFVGHYWEKRKPAFVDDLVGLLVGPLFLVAEVAFAVGLAQKEKDEVLRRAGPTLIRS